MNPTEIFPYCFNRYEPGILVGIYLPKKSDIRGCCTLEPDRQDPGVLPPFRCGQRGDGAKELPLAGDRTEELSLPLIQPIIRPTIRPIISKLVSPVNS
jgi:hypothetical protein